MVLITFDSPFRNICKQCLRAHKVFVSWCKQSGVGGRAGGGKLCNKVAIRMSVSWRGGGGGGGRKGGEGSRINTWRKGRRRRPAGATVIEIHRRSRWYLDLSRVLRGGRESQVNCIYIVQIQKQKLYHDTFHLAACSLFTGTFLHGKPPRASTKATVARKSQIKREETSNRTWNNYYHYFDLYL